MLYLFKVNLKLIDKSTGNVLFVHNGLWLHPLLALVRYLPGHCHNLTQCHLYDKVIGRAAALLIAKIGIPQVHTHTLSARAVPILEYYNIDFEYTRWVTRLSCNTEELLRNEWNREKAYNIILRLAN